MKSVLKIPFALLNGHLVHVSYVESGSKHGAVCPACSSALIARKGKLKIHHFAHRSDANCNAETALHRTAKILLYEEIKSALRNNQGIAVTWDCSVCESHHEGNLLKKARSVHMEHSLGKCRPDITLFDENSKPVAIIEVVVSHEPEEHVRKFCADHKIALLELHLAELSSLDALRPLSTFNATRGSVCTREKCPRCRAPLFEGHIYVVDGDCWKCKASMKIALGHGNSGMGGPDEFDAQAISAAKKHGVILRNRYSNVVQERYLANTCKHCGNFCGNFYLHDFWHLADEDTEVSTGVKCSECGWSRGPVE